MSQSTEPIFDLFPVLVYIYTEDGRYGPPLRINTDAELNSAKFKETLRDALRRKVKIMMTDMGDLCVFHAEHGKIYFDGKNHYKEGREIKL